MYGNYFQLKGRIQTKNNPDPQDWPVGDALGIVSVDVSIRWNLSMLIPSTLDATYRAQNFVSELV
jgi:hypothetical protein